VEDNAMKRVIACIILSACAALAAEPKAAPPNVLFILADDLGINDLGCYGRKDHNTPNLDKLAAAGSRFTAAYAACPVCSPTRAALLTGLAPARLHLTTFLPGRPDCPAQKLLHPGINQHLPMGTKTLADHLKAHGYATGCIGKWHLGGKGHLPTDHGFATYHPGRANTTPSDTEGGKGEYDLTQQAIHFLEKNRDRPFFLYLAHNSPHIPYTASPALVAKNAGAFEPTYAAVIESLDSTIGMLLAKLDELKLAGNTLVVFTSDNGGLHVPELKHARITHNTPFRAGKGFLYEGGIRVPLIARWPLKVPAGRVVDTPIISTDWTPTLLELAGARVPDDLDGVSFADLLLGKKWLVDHPLFWHLPHYTNQGSRPSGAVRDGNWKLLEHYEDGSVELFHITSDPGEKTNLAGSEKEWAALLRKKLAEWRKEVGAQDNSPNPKFDPALHKALYIDVDPSRYDPLTAGPAGLARLLEWRKRMDSVVPK
jgi:arylsulfatase A-like enzyme